MKKSIKVAEFIKTKRKEKKLSQNDLSNIVGMHKKPGCYQSLSNIERGKAQLPIKHLVKLSEALEVSPETIVELLIQDYREEITRNLGITKVKYVYPNIY
jgi:transcriptional regulator with XRE-family HTH domain